MRSSRSLIRASSSLRLAVLSLFLLIVTVVPTGIACKPNSTAKIQRRSVCRDNPVLLLREDNSFPSHNCTTCRILFLWGNDAVRRKDFTASMSAAVLLLIVRTCLTDRPIDSATAFSPIPDSMARKTLSVVWVLNIPFDSSIILSVYVQVFRDTSPAV